MVNPHRGDERTAWTRDSLQQVMRDGGRVEEVMVLANAEPFSHHVAANGGIRTSHSTSGLVAAVEPLIRATSGVWIAHGAGSADRQTVQTDDGLDVPEHHPRYRLRRVWLSDGEVQRYYDGFANEGLWPLCHRAHVRPVFRSEDFNTYWEINSRFVDRLCDEARSDAPLVLVQDYHFALAPMMIRARLPASTIVGFWHIPWPGWQTFEICPWNRQLLEGLLGADILGFQTPGDCANFIETVERILKEPVREGTAAVRHNGHVTEVRAYPTSIEWPSRWTLQSPIPQVCRRQVSEELKLSSQARLTVSVGRLDYTKGIEETFAALERLLENHPEYRGVLTHVQLAAPSRTRVPAYQEFGSRVADAARRINRRFGDAHYYPIVLLTRHYEPLEVYRLFRAADVCYVGSLHDGMNLVAKEFVAARDDERGALVLSAFAGAAWQLADALIVNPYDLDDVAASLVRALTMSQEEQRHRMGLMRQVMAEETAQAWAGRILTDVSRVRPLQATIAP